MIVWNDEKRLTITAENSNYPWRLECAFTYFCYPQGQKMSYIYSIKEISYDEAKKFLKPHHQETLKKYGNIEVILYNKIIRDKDNFMPTPLIEREAHSKWYKDNEKNS